MKACIVNVNPECLAELLGLPSGAIVVGIDAASDRFGTVRLRVVGAGPEVAPGCLLEVFTATLETTRLDDGKHFTRARVDFEYRGWKWPSGMVVTCEAAT